MSKEKLNQFSTDVLQKHSISGKALKQSFAGEPGGL